MTLAQAKISQVGPKKKKKLKTLAFQKILSKT